MDTATIIIVTVGACCFAFGWIAGVARGGRRP